MRRACHNEATKGMVREPLTPRLCSPRYKTLSDRLSEITL